MGKDKTLLANVGDSRAYIYKDRKLTQVTKDDSKVQMLYDRGEISSKEDMRFNRVSNQIYKALGFPGHDEPTFSVLENSKYDTLMLLSDGVSDFLSEHDIIKFGERKYEVIKLNIVNNNNDFKINQISENNKKFKSKASSKNFNR